MVEDTLYSSMTGLSGSSNHTNDLAPTSGHHSTRVIGCGLRSCANPPARLRGPGRRSYVPSSRSHTWVLPAVTNHRPVIPSSRRKTVSVSSRAVAESPSDPAAVLPSCSSLCIMPGHRARCSGPGSRGVAADSALPRHPSVVSKVRGTLAAVTLPEHEPSPVPSDSDLWPGELPFTAWGQHEHGTLDLRVFDQEVVVDIAQRPHRLAEEMSDEYIRNVIAHLETHVEAFYWATVRGGPVQMYGDLLLGRVSTDVVAEALGATPLTELTPREWLEGSRPAQGRRAVIDYLRSSLSRGYRIRARAAPTTRHVRAGESLEGGGAGGSPESLWARDCSADAIAGLSGATSPTLE